MSVTLDNRQLDLLGVCPVPRSRYDHVLLGHGSGGRLTADLIQRLFVPTFNNEVLANLEDQATLTLPSPPPPLPQGERGANFLPSPLGGEGAGVRGQRIAFTTDSFVVRPLFFPGGDIGKLAVHGTVN